MPADPTSCVRFQRLLLCQAELLQAVECLDALGIGKVRARDLLVDGGNLTIYEQVT